MGLQAFNQALFAAVVVDSVAGALIANSGAFASATKLGTGLFRVFTDGDFRLRPDDVINAQAANVTAVRTVHLENATTQTQFDVRVTDGAGAEVDADVQITIQRTFRG